MAGSSEKTEQAYIALLRNFESDLEEVHLTNGVMIRRFNLQTDTEGDWKEALFSGVFDPNKASVLVLSVQEDEGWVGWVEVFNDTITAMRIMAAGGVRIAQFLKPQLLLVPGRSFGVPTYHLAEEFIDTLGALTERLPQVTTDFLRVAISRFNLAYERDQSEDRFIDIWIGLEALFSPTDKTEVKYRIALRVAHFIEQPGPEREEVYHTVRESYDLRSQVVHGRKLTLRPSKKLKLAPVQVLEQTEDYLRRSLRNIILSDKPFDENALDVSIARGS